MKQEELKKIVLRCMNGEEEAFEVLYKAYIRKVYYICLRFLKDEEDAADVAQETFVTAFQKLLSLEKPESFGIWISHIASNKCKNILIKRSRGFEEELVGGAEELEVEELNIEFIPEEYAVNKEKRSIIIDIIDNELSDVQRMAIILYYYEEKTVAEIAEILECSEGTVKSRLNSARKLIKSAIEEKEKKGYKILGITVCFVLSDIIAAEASEQELPKILSGLDMNVLSKQLDFKHGGKNRMKNQGMLVKIIGACTSVVAVVALVASIVIFSNGDGQKETSKTSGVINDSDNVSTKGNVENNDDDETTKQEGKWKYFNGDKLDVNLFDENKWDKKLYFEDVAYEIPLKVESLVALADEEYNIYEIRQYKNGAGELVKKSGIVTLDEVIAPYEDEYTPNDNSRLYIKKDEESFCDGFKYITVVFPKSVRFGDALVQEVAMGNFEYPTREEDMAILDKIKLTENGKNLRDMSYLDIIEELGQPSLYVDSYYTVYRYKECVLFFSFSYDEEVDNYMCVELCIGLEGGSKYDEESLAENWVSFTPNECELEE